MGEEINSNQFTCRNCGGGDRGRVAIYRPFGEVSLSLNRTVTCMVLKANDRRTSCPCHDEFRGPRSDYVRQLEKLVSQLELLMADNKKILNIMTMFGKPSSSLDSKIYFNKPRQPDLKSSFLPPGCVAVTKASRRTRSAWSSLLMPLGTWQYLRELTRSAAGLNCLRHASEPTVLSMRLSMQNSHFPRTQRAWVNSET
ncbi:uncharacterized protein TNCV_4978851 [Trichonephila clavipes]|nr:uncharacterized protein TNCV_4978851 [Trichonephila clavipes]